MIWIRKLLYTILGTDFSNKCLVKVEWWDHPFSPGWWGCCMKCGYKFFTCGNEKDARESARQLSKGVECEDI